MKQKRPRRNDDWQLRRTLGVSSGLQDGDFQSNGLLSEKGLKRAEILLEKSMSPELKNLFKIYCKSLKNRKNQ